MHSIADVDLFRDVHFGCGTCLNPRVLAQMLQNLFAARSIGLPARTGKDVDTFTVAGERTVGLMGGRKRRA